MIAPALATMIEIVAAAPEIRFAPVERAPLTVETRETHVSAASTLHFTMRHRVSFARFGTGWRMDATLLDSTTDANGTVKATYEASMRPFLGVTTAVAVSTAGKPVSALDADAAWAKISQGQRAAADTLARSGLPPRTIAAMRANFESIVALTGEARDAMLTAFAWDLLSLSAPSQHRGGRQPYAGTTSVPGAGDVAETGTSGFDGMRGADALFSLDAEADPADLARVADTFAAHITGGDPAARARIAAAVERLRTIHVRRHDEYVVDSATGLLRTSTSRRETQAASGPTEIVERTITVVPAR